MLKNIIVTGGEGRFALSLKKIKSKYKFIFRNKKQLDILSMRSIKKNLKSFKPDCILHLAGLSRPMSVHEKNISKSIYLNIIGTANIVKACAQNKIKLIFFSTNYIYPGNKGKYQEDDPLLPWNNYGWSKLGGESAVQIYKNSLIIRACMTENPFVHKSAFTNVKTNFIFHEDFAKIFLKVLHYRGVLNIGGKTQSIYKFAKKYKKNVSKKRSKGELPFKMDMSLKKVNRLIKR